ncbi:hypothetical protein P4544_00015 [Halomonas sp. LY9]
MRDGLDDYDADYTQQLKPMASELAGKLRRWANKAEESLEKLEESAQKDDEQAAKVQEESVAKDDNACTSDDSFVQSASLDDQSDYSSHAQEEQKRRLAFLISALGRAWLACVDSDTTNGSGKNAVCAIR